MAEEWAIHPEICGGSPKRLDAAIADLADRQHGVVARAQLFALGVSRRSLEHRLELRRLHPVHLGVYAVGRRGLTSRGRWMAGVLRAGPGAALSHRPAAALVGIRRWVAGDVEVSVAADRRSRSGLRIYRTDLPADEVTIIDGIPVTTVPRTLLDLAAVLKPHQLEAAINEAEAERLTDPLSLADVIERHPRRKGIAAVRAILGAGRIGTTVTRSEFEERVVAFLDSFKLPRPEFNMHVDAGDRLYECDCVWRAERLVVELDGRQTHDTGQAFESDRARDRALQAAGWRVVRITWWQLHHEAATIVAHLRLLLGRR